MTPLDSFVRLELMVGPQNVVRCNHATSATVNGSATPGVRSGQTLGTAVVAGMVLATAPGLLLTPVFYAVIQRAKERLRPGADSAAEESESAAPVDD